jgi:hypothetical protein
VSVKRAIGDLLHRPALHVPVTCMPHDDGISGGWHRHRCADPTCGHVWAHDGHVIGSLDDKSHMRAHTCPICGSHTDNQYFCL